VNDVNSHNDGIKQFKKIVSTTKSHGEISFLILEWVFFSLNLVQ